MSGVLSIILIVLMNFVPIENLIVTFNSPKSVYDYYTWGKSEIQLVVNGKQSDLVIGNKNGADNYLIVPKTPGGWKIGIGLNTKRVSQKIYNGIVIYVYQYKDTNDYYVTIMDTRGNYLKISDSYNSQFLMLEKENSGLKKTFVTYYANITQYSSQYSIYVDGNQIILE